MGGIGMPVTLTWVCWLVFISVLMVKAPTLGNWSRRGHIPNLNESDYGPVGQDEFKEDTRPSDDSFQIGED